MASLQRAATGKWCKETNDGKLGETVRSKNSHTDVEALVSHCGAAICRLCSLSEEGKGENRGSLSGGSSFCQCWGIFVCNQLKSRLKSMCAPEELLAAAAKMSYFFSLSSKSLKA